MADEVKVIRIVIDSSKAVDGSSEATRALARMEKSFGDATSALSRMERSLMNVAVAVRAHLALAISELIVKLTIVAKESLAAVGGLDEMAEQAGITAAGLQALQASAVQNGVTLEQLQTGVAKFSQKMGEAAGGSKEVIDSLNKLGVQILDVNGKLKPTETNMENIARAILAIEDPAKRAAASVDFFSKAGTKFQPMLQDMAKGFQLMGYEAERSGTMLDDHVRKRLDELGDAAERNKLLLRALFAETAVAILDFAERAKTALSNAFNGQWIDDWRKARDTFMVDANGFVHAVGDLFSGLGDTIGSAFVKGLNTALEAAEGFLNKLRRGAQSWFTTNAPPEVNLGRVGGGGGGALGWDAAFAAGQAEARAWIERQDRPGYVDPEDAMRGGPRLPINFLAGFGRDGGKNPSAAGGSGKQEADEVAKLIEKIAKEAERAREAFASATDEIENQNEVMQAELRLMDAAPDIRARELAVIKATNEAKKAGVDIESEAFRARVAAVETNEKLKSQQDELKKSQELWTEPLKQALGDIQRIGADAFEKMLESGNFSFQSLAQTFGQIIRRMAAEFLALATIRPVMSVLVNAVSPSMAQQMGLGGTGLSGVGGGSGLSLGGGGGLSGFMNQPIFGGIDSEIANWSTYGTAAQNSLGGMTWGSALGIGGGLLSMGMGAASLFSGKGGAGSMVGGIGGILGGGLGIAGALMPSALGGMLGPIGMGVGLLASFLPGLLGGEEKKPPKLMATGGLNFAGGKWLYNGSEYNGGQGLGGTLGGVGGSMKSLMDAAGVTSLTSSNSLNYQTLSQGEFSNATTFVNGTQWGQGSGNDAGLDTAAAHIAHMIMMEAGSGISDTMRRGLGNYGQQNLDYAFSTQELGQTVAELKGFEDTIKSLGKTTSAVEKALDDVDASFAGLLATAEKYGLDPTDAQNASNKARQGVFDDFAGGIRLGILDITDPQAAALQRLDDEKKTYLENNDAIVKAFGETASQLVQIEELYGLKRAKIVEQYADQATTALQSSLMDTIKRLTMGDLAGLSPEAAYSGAKGTYNALLAQAKSGNQSALSQINSAAAEFSSASRAYNASSAGFYSDNNRIVSDLAGLSIAQGGDAASLAQMNALLVAIGNLITSMQNSNDNSVASQQKLDEALDLWNRLAATLPPAAA